MTGGAAARWPGGHAHPGADGTGAGPGRARPALAVLSLALVVAALVPPLSTAARRIDALEALQFSLLAIAVPALVAVAAPWRWLGLAAAPAVTADAEGSAVVEWPRPADRAAAARRRHPEAVRSVGYLALETVAVVAWRVPASVDALARHGWLSWVEALTLVIAGTGLWLELVESPPFRPRLARPARSAVAAVAMWTVWVTAYLVGLSDVAVYRAYAHVPGHDLSVGADQAIATGILWFISLCAFVPVVFSNFLSWLRTDEDPDEALYRLVRDGRRTVDLPAGMPSAGRPPSG